MIVLHAGILGKSFYLWGEKSPEPEDRPGRRRSGREGLKTAGRLAEAYPFDAGAAGLLFSLTESGIGFKINKRSVEAIILRLPAAGTLPVPSSSLIAGPPNPEGEATLLAWKVSVLRLPVEHAVEFLCAGTLEEKIDEMIERKKGIAEQVIGTGEGWLTELSTAELRDLFSLRREAVGTEE